MWAGALATRDERSAAFYAHEIAVTIKLLTLNESERARLTARAQHLGDGAVEPWSVVEAFLGVVAEEWFAAPEESAGGDPRGGARCPALPTPERPR